MSIKVLSINIIIQNQIYADYNKLLGAYKIAHVLQRDYGINISVGFVFRQLFDSLNVVQSFSKKGYPFEMLATNVSSNTSKRKELTGEAITLCRSYSYPYLNILKLSITLRDHMALWEY